MRRLVLEAATAAGTTPVLDTPDGVEAVRRRAPDGTGHLFLLNHTPHEATINLGTKPCVDLLDPGAPTLVTGRLRLPPYGAAVLRDNPHPSN
jgi:beta-galactosidase